MGTTSAANKLIISEFRAAEAAAKLAKFTYDTAVARPGIATTEKGKVETLMAAECILGFTTSTYNFNS